MKKSAWYIFADGYDGKLFGKIEELQQWANSNRNQNDGLGYGDFGKCPLRPLYIVPYKGR